MKIRHGDVLLEKVETMPDGLKLVKGRNWVALGEVTGHAHRIDIGEIFEEKDGKLYLKTDKLTKLSHEEHKTITLEPGIYRVTIKRQYIPDGWERVAD